MVEGGGEGRGEGVDLEAASCETRSHHQKGEGRGGEASWIRWGGGGGGGRTRRAGGKKRKTFRQLAPFSHTAA